MGDKAGKDVHQLTCSKKLRPSYSRPKKKIRPVCSFPNQATCPGQEMLLNKTAMKLVLSPEISREKLQFYHKRITRIMSKHLLFNIMDELIGFFPGRYTKASIMIFLDALNIKQKVQKMHETVAQLCIQKVYVVLCSDLLLS